MHRSALVHVNSRSGTQSHYGVCNKKEWGRNEETTVRLRWQFAPPMNFAFLPGLNFSFRPTFRRPPFSGIKPFESCLRPLGWITETQ
jgi:hypothetical protein